MTKKVFIWVAHPKTGSLSSGLAQAYAAGAKSKGAEVRIMELSDMAFEIDFKGYTSDHGDLAPDLQTWQENISWADHVMFIHPYWWGAMPTQAKAVLDMALLPGFGYKYRKKGMLWDKLLTGRTADAIITSDTPPWLDTLIYRKPARRVIRNQVLGFVGMKVRNVVQFGSVKTASKDKIQKWLGRAERLGAKAVA